MTRKHYKKLAAVLKVALHERIITREVILEITNILEEENRAFNRYKFLEAVSSVDCYAL